MTPEPPTEIEATTLQVRPQQFELREIVWMATGIAIACAIFAPVLRDLSAEQLWFWMCAVAIQFTSFTIAVGWAMIRRRNMLIRAGRCLGQGRTADYGTLEGMASWMSRPVASGMIMMTQVVLGFLLLTLTGKYLIWNDYFAHALIGWIGAATLVSLRFGRHLGGVEFFENGISHIPTAFIPWEQIEVHPDNARQDVIWLSYYRWRQSVPASVFKVVVSEGLKRLVLMDHADPETAES